MYQAKALAPLQSSAGANGRFELGDQIAEVTGVSGSTVKKDDEVGVGPEKLPSKLGSKNKNDSYGTSPFPTSPRLDPSSPGNFSTVSSLSGSRELGRSVLEVTTKMFTASSSNPTAQSGTSASPLQLATSASDEPELDPIEPAPTDVAFHAEPQGLMQMLSLKGSELGKSSSLSHMIWFAVVCSDSAPYLHLSTQWSRGDVQPYIALAKGLQADGHRVRIATHAEFGDWIIGHGIDFSEIGGDPAELMRICVENGTFTVSFLREGVIRFRDWLDDLASEHCAQKMAAAERNGNKWVKQKVPALYKGMANLLITYRANGYMRTFQS
ncbi:related to UDP-glucose:sterol glucosyltransferase [Ustilago sp. UG-2017b]|nr:related to UDP-glucose:sterol glucosyltransferase [Ustilago sp. UG-2017b]